MDELNIDELEKLNNELDGIKEDKVADNQSATSNTGGNNNNGSNSYSNNRNNNGNNSNDIQANPPKPEELDPKNLATANAYTIVGWEDVPDEIKEKMSSLAIKLSERGYTLRLPLSDNFNHPVKKAMFAAASPRVELYSPWKTYIKKAKFDVKVDPDDVISEKPSIQAHKYLNELMAVKKDTGERIYENLTLAQKGYNACQLQTLLGKNLKSPVKFILYFGNKEPFLPSRVAKKTGAALMDIGKPDFMSSFIEYFKTI